MKSETKRSSFWHMLPVIFTLAWPTMLEQLMQTAVQYIDTAMVGTLGTDATAAVGSTATVNWLISITISALSIGFLAYIAQATGAKDHSRAVRASGQAVLATLVTGLLFTVLALSLSGLVPVWMQVDTSIQRLASEYFFILYLPMLPRAATIFFGTVLRAVGDTKTPMRVGLLINVINVILNFLLIYPTRDLWFFTMPGMGLGVHGAALASAIAFTVGGICMTAVLWKHPDISPKGQSLRPDWLILKPCLKVAIPNMLQGFVTSLGYVTFASMINALGEISTAATTIANTVEGAFYIPGFGMQTAAATLSGNTLGAGDRQRMKDLTRMLLVLEFVLMCISGGLLFAFAPAMVKLFSDNRQVIDLCTLVLRMVALSEPIFGISIIIQGILQGVGKTMTPFVYNAIGMWGVRIVGTFICTQMLGMGLVSAWACMIAHNVLLCILFVIHFVRGKWNPLNH